MRFWGKTMRMLSSAFLGAVLFLGNPAFAADPTDPNWPCIQRKILRLSAGVIWPHPIPETPATLTEEATQLSQALALRRVSLEDAEQQITEYAAKVSGQESDWTPIFTQVFQKIDRNRTKIISGIERYAEKQQILAAQIDDLRLAIDDALAKAEPDYDKVDAIEVDLDWKSRIFEDRNRALTYVCESPVLLEKRAYSLAKLLAEQIKS